ncbi:TonB-dependent receptor [Rubrivivax gelatinosus]|uniref:TonB-dependent receptor n=1 Tax=Rubrivivax gelatinosus TaxID=28068 RepID=UPI001F5BE5A5|nr:TonB-dependent receptor [Rubrivivax gelatinosus]
MRRPSSARPLRRALPFHCLNAVAAALLVPAAHAEDGAETKPEVVVVTATRGSKALDKIPGAVNVISRGDIETQTLVSEDPSALLALQVPGYAPARQKLSNFGEGLRGRNALLLLDGIPQTNPLRFGGREGYFADPMIVERIEVVSGASAVQGMGATGGIINTITRRPTELGTRQTVELKYGTQGHANTQSWKTGYMVEHRSAELDGWDLLAYVGLRSQDVGIDGAGRTLATESLHRAGDAFVKIGRDFGAQRLQLMLNRFEADGFDDWVDVPGDRDAGVPTTSRHGSLAWDAPRNRVRSASLEWSHADLGGGYASAQLFKQDFEARYSGGVISTFQDAAIAPVGTLVDQSQIEADKWGLRTSWVRPDLGLAGLEFTAGLDLLHDTSSQRLTLTGRTWVPPLRYESLAPFTQLEYTRGNLTLRGGLRDERNSLTVDDYRTLAFYGSRAVEGGKRDAHELVKSLGGVWRFDATGWSAFASYNEGFGPPDAGLILRAVKTDGQSVDKLVDLQPVVTRNREVGVSWRGTSANFSASLYRSRSDLGSQIVVANGIGSVQRVPIEVKGFEFAGQWRPLPALRLDASYARTRGRTAAAAGEPLDLDLGARSQGPDKLVLGGQWAFAPAWRAQLNVARWFSRDANEGKFSGSTSLEEHFEGYTVADLALRWASPWGELGAGVENLFDRRYITYYSQSHYAGTDEDYYAGRGRTLTLNWRRSF